MSSFKTVVGIARFGLVFNVVCIRHEDMVARTVGKLQEWLTLEKGLVRMSIEWLQDLSFEYVQSECVDLKLYVSNLGTHCSRSHSSIFSLAFHSHSDLITPLLKQGVAEYQCLQHSIVSSIASSPV